MKIGGMGGMELVIILLVVLIIFGPKNLPKLGKALGQTVSSLREGLNRGESSTDESVLETSELQPEASDSNSTSFDTDDAAAEDLWADEKVRA